MSEYEELVMLVAQIPGMMMMMVMVMGDG